MEVPTYDDLREVEREINSKLREVEAKLEELKQLLLGNIEPLHLLICSGTPIASFSSRAAAEEFIESYRVRGGDRMHKRSLFNGALERQLHITCILPSEQSVWVTHNPPPRGK